MAYIVKGLIAQLTNSVRPTGLALLPALRTSAKSILTMMGYIMKNRQIAIGIDTTGALPTYTARPSSVRANWGAILPRMIPPTIQRMTQAVRYFSKTFNPFVSNCLAFSSAISRFLACYSNGPVFKKTAR